MTNINNDNFNKDDKEMETESTNCAENNECQNSDDASKDDMINELEEKVADVKYQNKALTEQIERLKRAASNIHKELQLVQQSETNRQYRVKKNMLRKYGS